MVGFLTHTGYSHGGNGFEGMVVLLERFKDHALREAGDPNHGIDQKAMATAYAKSCKAEKRLAQELGQEVRALPGVHHPVFKGKPVNHDPRERFIATSWPRAATTTSSMPSIANWCRRSTTSARRRMTSASTSTR
jgi:citrate synthase